MPRALVTGASGFVAPYLIRHLLNQGYEVVGGVYNSQARLPEGCRQLRLDVTDRKRVQGAIANMQPDEVYHLAALTRLASGAVGEYYRVNLGGVLNLLEAVREHAPETRLLLVGSAYVYGRVDHPIAEAEPLNPTDHYGVSKASADLLGYSYALRGLKVVRARPFNHSGPGQSPQFVLSTLVQQFVEIRAGKRKPIVQLGNLDSVRDFSDVRDIVKAYHLALQRGRPGEVYNLGSGRGLSIRELFELVCQEAGVEARLSVAPSRVRPTDIPYMVGDVNKARKELNWEPEIVLKQTIKDMLDTSQGELS